MGADGCRAICGCEHKQGSGALGSAPASSTRTGSNFHTLSVFIPLFKIGKRYCLIFAKLFVLLMKQEAIYV